MTIEFKPKPKLVALTVRLPEDLSKALDRIAAKEKVKRTDVIVAMLGHGVKDYEARK